MATLVEKIYILYPDLETTKYGYVDGVYVSNPLKDGTIILQNDSDGRGDYIAKWEHPTLAKPTDEQLAAVGE